MHVVHKLNLPGQGKINLDEDCILFFIHRLNHLQVSAILMLDARPRIYIGKRVHINNNAVIIADKSLITIGDNNVICAGSVMDQCIHPNFIEKASKYIDFIDLNINAYNPRIK
ncbi:hypothetical protein M2R28_02545 [Aeromonas hydrophila]|uniref:hypothetical protein n=1 Tax=Aeromonas hydrophila TaxID=644 RepID=UPI00208DF525|nr:hypothetical protein [Aeromonas hydrophila]MCO4198567.1 hypothetical protein [Aeromonas hydrophila]